MTTHIKPKLLSNYMAVMFETSSIFTEKKEMSPENALLIGRAIGRSFKHVTIGTDANPSSGMIKNSVVTGLLSVGVDVKDVGIAPAPAVALSSSSHCDCIIMVGEPDEQGMISGIDIMGPDGAALSPEEIKQLMKIAESERRLPDYKGVGTLQYYDSVISDYIHSALERHSKCDDSPVVLDCGCGCTALCAPQILAALGADLTTINAQSDTKHSSRPPGVKENDLSVLARIVVSNAGSIGIALNGNGTRLALIDEGGNYVEPDQIIALVLLYLKPASLVIPVNISAVVDDALSNLIGEGINTPHKAHSEHHIIRTDDDLESVVRVMKENNMDVGALSDGTLIFSDISMCPDAVNTAAILTKMSGSNSIRNLLSSFPKYTVLKDSIRHTGNQDMFAKKLTEKLKEVDTEEVWQVDGWRVDMNYGWFTVSRNKSNPERIDITAESKDRAYAVSMMELAKEIVHGCV
jgi:Phosphomannomutase